MVGALTPGSEGIAATITADAVAGVTFAVVNIPQAMANALLAGVNPVLGLYTLMIATPVGALFTSSVFMNVSTTSALSVAAGDVLLGVPAEAKTASLVVLVVWVGVVQFLAGLFRLGSLLRFVSRSVMVGFIGGVATLNSVRCLRFGTHVGSGDGSPGWYNRVRFSPAAGEGPQMTDNARQSWR